MMNTHVTSSNIMEMNTMNANVTTNTTEVNMNNNELNNNENKAPNMNNNKNNNTNPNPNPNNNENKELNMNAENSTENKELNMNAENSTDITNTKESTMNIENSTDITNTKETTMNNENSTDITNTKETTMNIENSTDITNIKESTMNIENSTDITNTKETTMNIENSTDITTEMSTTENKEHAFRIKGKGSLEVNPGYFSSKCVKKHGLVFFKGNGWFEWTKDGWAPLRKSILQSRIRDLLKNKVESYCNSAEMNAKSKSQTPFMPAYELVNTGNINEILRMMTIDCDRGDTLPQLDPDVVPLQNGVLRWNDKKQDFVFGKYTQKDLIFSRLDAVYDPKAESELFQKKLAEILPNEDDRRVVQEYMGAALFPENRTRKFMLFQGEGGCGKSLLVKLLTGIMTLDRTFDLDFRALRANYAFSALTTQTLLTASEAISEAFCQSAGIEFVKKAVGGDFFATSQKYRNEKYDHYGFYSFIIVSNNEMRFKYDSRGDEFKDRLIPILFNEHIENPDKTLADKLLMDHRSAILNWLLDGARRVRKNNWNIQLTDDQISRRDRIVEATRGVEIFVKNHVVESAGKNFRTSKAYELFTRLHKTAGYEYLPEDTFRKRLAKTMGMEFGATPSNTIPVEEFQEEYDSNSKTKKVKVKTARGYRGFKLVDPNAKKTAQKTAEKTQQAINTTNNEGINSHE